MTFWQLIQPYVQNSTMTTLPRRLFQARGLVLIHWLLWIRGATGPSGNGVFLATGGGVEPAARAGFAPALVQAAAASATGKKKSVRRFMRGA